MLAGAPRWRLKSNVGCIVASITHLKLRSMEMMEAPDNLRWS